MSDRFVILLFALLLPWFVSDVSAQDDHDHVNEQKAREAHDDLADDDDHEGHNEELIVELTPEAMKLAGITISIVKQGRIDRTIELPGEVGFNDDRVAHIAPRFAGIAQQATYRVGDYVETDKVMAIVESNESMNSYTITAPFSGWVIERHITPGEFVSEENSIYVIADLSSVWVNLAVYPKDFDRVKKGQMVQIKAVGSMNSTTGTIDYITPIIDFRTRSATARITLPNPDNAWRPGTFVQASITTEGRDENLVVEKDAVQYLSDTSVVFVVDGPNRFRPVEVVTGDSDAKYTQIVSGLSEGIEYVPKGAFELKAKIVTSNLDAHAGHGH
ncbi:MAG: efflux RND transporter periplasmic adaptor subunit [bacterium]